MAEKNREKGETTCKGRREKSSLLKIITNFYARSTHMCLRRKACDLGLNEDVGFLPGFFH